MEVCDTTKKNLALSKCTKLPQLPRCIITTSEDFSFAPSALVSKSAFKAALEAAMYAGKATRVYLWPFFKGFENASEEVVRESTPLATMKVRDGRYGFKFMVVESLCLHKDMFSHRANGGRVFIYDINGQLTGTKDSDGNFLGFRISLLDTEKLQFSDGSVSTKSPLFLELADNLELDQDGYVLGREIASVINTVQRLADVTVEAVSQTTASIIVKVYVTCDGSPVNGLLPADFIVKTSPGGVAQVLTAAAEADGTYTLSKATAFATGSFSVTLKPSSTISLPGYETSDTIVVVIP